jgi:hypothetical protein
MVIYNIFVVGTDQKSNMAARTHNVFWLVEILKIFLLETTKHLNCDFAGMIIGLSCTKLEHRLAIGNSRWPPWLDLV